MGKKSKTTVDAKPDVSGIAVDLGEAQVAGSFAVPSSINPASLDTSQWPLLLKV